MHPDHHPAGGGRTGGPSAGRAAAEGIRAGVWVSGGGGRMGGEGQLVDMLHT